EGIGALVMERLRRLDQVAYVRFASVYKNFNAAEEFGDILRELGHEEASGEAAEDGG
ncbi:MAG: transcriptional regulator NrdR, partial [Methylobacterium sp.]|nr:transcriptional regulator NrdR [Methylobacterium sp.]